MLRLSLDTITWPWSLPTGRRSSNSQDKVVIARVQDNPTQPPTFRIGQVDLDSSDPQVSSRFGVYRVKWWRPHLDDVKTRSMVNSRFWPDVWTLRTDGGFGHAQSVRPERAKAATADDDTLHWQDGDVSLAEDLIVGPFDFSQVRKPMQGPKRKAISESYRVDETYWTILQERAEQFGIDIANIRSTPTDGQQFRSGQVTQR